MKKSKTASAVTAMPMGLREVLDGAPEAIVCFDSSGVWSWLSPAVESLAGTKPASMIGKPCLEILPPSQRARALRLMLTLQKSAAGTSHSFNCTILHAEQGERPIELSVRVVERPDGEMAYVGVAREAGIQIVASPAPPASEDETPASSEKAEGVSGESSELQKELDEVRHRSAWLASELLEARAALKKAESERDEAAQRAESAKESGTKDTAKSNAEVEELRRRLDEATQKIEAERSTERDVDKRADQLESQLEIERAATAAATRSAEETRAELESTKANLQLLQQRTEDMGSEIEKLRKQPATPATGHGTEGKQLEAAIAERDQARAEVRERAELLSTLNHEIRNPMNGVIGMADLLLDTKLDDNQRQQVEVIRNSARALMSVMGDWMDFSRLKVGKVELEEVDFDLRVTMDEVTSMLRPFATEKGITFEREVHHEVPSRLRGDAGRLRQVLLNLGGNSIRFTESGRVAISVERAKESDDRVTLRFIIHDTGLGIAEATAAGFFKTRGGSKPAAAPRHGTHGMGMTVARQIVELMGGETGVESRPGAGSRFWFQVQLSKQPEVGAVAATLKPVRGARVLVVDNAKGSRQALVHTLATLGNRVDEAANGEEALERLERAAKNKDAYVAAFVDMALPDLNGEQLGARVRANPALGSTRLILLADVGQPGDGSRSHGLGFSGYFVKPIKPWEVESALAEVLRDEPAGQRVPLVTRHLVAENKRSRVTILVVDDDTVSQLVSDWTLRRQGYRVERATSGEDALRRHEELSPDLILVDLALPDIDGFELARRLRARDKDGRHVPIVAVTGRAGKADRDRCREAGMDDFLTKPVELADLTRIVEQWTSTAASAAPAPNVPDSSAQPPPHEVKRAAPPAAPAPPPPSARAVPPALPTAPIPPARPAAPTSPAPPAAPRPVPPGTVARITPPAPPAGPPNIPSRPNLVPPSTGGNPEKPNDPDNPVRLVRPGEVRETPSSSMEGFELRPRSSNTEDGPPLELTDDPDSVMGAPELPRPRPKLSSKTSGSPSEPAAEKPATPKAKSQKPSREIQIKPDTSGGKLMAEPPLDMKRLEDASMGIPAFRDALLRTFLNDLRPRLDRLDQALINRSSDRLEMEAHGLKGMSATIGATKVAEIFAEIERLSRENLLEQAEEMIAKARLEAERLETHLKTLNLRHGRGA